MTGKAAGSKKRAGAASSAPSKKSKINDRKKETKQKEDDEEEEEEEEEQTPEVGKNPTGKSEATSPLLVFAHGAGANSSHEWMVRYVHSYPHVNFLELESFRS